MFDALFSRPGSGGYLASARKPSALQLESLEARDVPAIIGGMVYNDVNQNGLYDPGEPGIANSTLQLRDSSNALVATTVSNASGQYQFSQRMGSIPQPGMATYEANFQQTKTNVTRSASIPMFDPSIGTLTSVEIIAEGNIQSSVQMENLEDAAADFKAELNGTLRYQVGGRTYQSTPERVLEANLGAYDGSPDLQGSSARDFGVTQLDGTFTRTTLTNPSDMAAFMGTGSLNVSQNASMASCACGPGNLLAMIRSTAGGKVKVVYRYQPNNSIGPGSYTVIQTTQPSGFRDGLETRDNITTISGSSRSDYITVGVVNINDQLITNHFGEVRPAAISGRVYHDVDRSGRFSSGDRALVGVSIILTGTDIFGNAVSLSTTTNASGQYAFAPLTAGNYTIREVQPNGYQQGTNNVGSSGGQVSGDTMTLTLSSGVSATEYNFGEILTSTPPPVPVVSPPPSTVPPPSKYFLFGGLFGWSSR